MTLLLTGGCGFIGANLTRYLLETTDYEITVLDRIDDAASLGKLEPLFRRYPTRLSIIWHDLRAAINPTSLGLTGEFEHILHLAAGSHVDRSVRDPIGFLLDNCIGTAHVLQYARDHLHPSGRTLVFSTDEVVGSAHNGECFTERDPMNPLNPYAAAKAAGEVLAPAWANTYGLPVQVTRCTNVYGPAQHPEKFIPLCIRKILAGEMIQIHAKDGVSSSRYYVHVDDVSRAVLTVLMKGGIIGSADSGRYNIAGSEELENLTVAEQVAAHLGQTLRYELVDFVPNRPRHDMRYALNGAKLSELGWEPEVSFEAGLASTIDWYTGGAYGRQAKAG